MITFQIPKIILEAHQTESIQEVLTTGLVILEYLNGHLSIQECGDILNIGYRGFLDLLWRTRGFNLGYTETGRYTYY